MIGPVHQGCPGCRCSPEGMELATVYVNWVPRWDRSWGQPYATIVLQPGDSVTYEHLPLRT